MGRKEEFENAKNLLQSNFNEGWSIILSLAESDYEEAMEYIALCYYRGDGVAMDEPKAYQWFQRIVRLTRKMDLYGINWQIAIVTDMVFLKIIMKL
jgi:TPR repeat protein